jgi:hypothetical protein
VPNDCYILNRNPRPRTLPVRPDVSVSVLPSTNASVPRPVAYANFPTCLAGDVNPHDDKLWTNPFRLTVRDDRIESIVEKYRP